MTFGSPTYLYGLILVPLALLFLVWAERRRRRVIARMGEPQLIAFNVRFLREVLDVINTPNVAIETTADTSPGVIRPVGEDNFVHVIMPMHLGN